MLWEDGRATKSFTNFASLITSGYNAVKAADSSIKIIVHISNGYNNGLFRWMFDSLSAKSARFDIIGMSLYPTTSNWSTLTSQCLSTMNDMVTRYDKEIMIAEVGMASSAAQTTKDMLTDLIGKVKSVPGGKGRGIFYWEPESFNWCGYSMGAWNINGRPTMALDAFLAGAGIREQNPGRGPAVAPGLMRVFSNSSASTVSVRYRLRNSCLASMKIIDIFGREVVTIVNRTMPAGVHTMTWNPENLSSGAYYCSLKSGGKIDVMMFSLLR
jgi:hypothetical protein